MLDGSKAAVETLKQQFPNCSYGKITELPYEDNFFDLIHSSHVVEHLAPQELYDFLKDADRCLRPGGYLIISAPLFWTEFYDDLSHLKPYNPKLFSKYLSWGTEFCCTRPLISKNYKVVEKVSRYNMLPYDELEVFIHSEVINSCLQLFRKIKHKLGFRRIEISGFSIVLKKGGGPEG